MVANRLLRAALLLAVLAAPAAALDYELEIGAESEFLEYSGESDLFYVLDTAGALYLAPLPGLSVAAEGGVGARYANGESFDFDESFSLRIDRFYARWDGPIGAGREFSAAGGRIGFRDVGGLIIDAPADGLLLGLSDGLSSLSFRIGTTALLFDDSSLYLETGSEASRVDPLFGPSRLVALLDFEHRVGDTIRLGASLTGNVDLVEEEPGVEFDGDLLDSFTLGVGLEGEPSPGLFYRIFLAGQQSAYYGGGDREYLYTRGIGLVAGSGVAAALAGPREPVLRAALLFASGDGEHPLMDDAGGGISNQFRPVSDPELGGIYPLALSNILLSTLSCTLRPLPERDDLRLELAAAGIVRPAGGAGTLTGADPADAPAGYLGSQLDLGLQWRPAGAFELELTAGIFLPGGTEPAEALLASGDSVVRIGLFGGYRLATPGFRGENELRRGRIIETGLPAPAAGAE